MTNKLNGLTISEIGTKRWYKDGGYHKEDGPAVEETNGSWHWYLNDKRHRIGGPATQYENGDKHWFVDGKRHRIGGPAIEFHNGDMKWFVNGKYIGDSCDQIPMTNEKFLRLMKLKSFL